VTAQG